MQRITWLAAVGAVLVAGASTGCAGGSKVVSAPASEISQPKAAQETVEGKSEPAVIPIEADDPEMKAAIDRALDTVGEFLAALQDPKEEQSRFSVKMPITDGLKTEHMWVYPVRYENGKFVGKINNTPLEITTLKIDDEIAVAPDEISDWMYVENGKLVGGYSIRVLRNGMSKKEREEFDKSLSITVD